MTLLLLPPSLPLLSHTEQYCNCIMKAETYEGQLSCITVFLFCVLATRTVASVTAQIPAPASPLYLFLYASRRWCPCLHSGIYRRAQSRVDEAASDRSHSWCPDLRRQQHHSSAWSVVSPLLSVRSRRITTALLSVMPSCRYIRSDWARVHCGRCGRCPSLHRLLQAHQARRCRHVGTQWQGAHLRILWQGLCSKNLSPSLVAILFIIRYLSMVRWSCGPACIAAASSCYIEYSTPD